MIDRLMTDALRLAKLSRSARLTATVIDMIADGEHPPGEQPLPRRNPWRSSRPRRSGGRQSRSPRHSRPCSSPLSLARSMRTVLTDLQERPDSRRHGDDGGEDDVQYGGQDDLTIPNGRIRLQSRRHPPVRPARRVPPWAGGMAFVVVATSAIALQHYLQSGAPVLALTDRSRAVVSSVFGDTTIRPAVTSDDPAPAPVEFRFHRRRNRHPSWTISRWCRWRWSNSPMLSPPVINGEAEPRDAQATVAEEAPEPPAAQETLPMRPVPPEEPVTELPAETAPTSRAFSPGTRRDRST